MEEGGRVFLGKLYIIQERGVLTECLFKNRPQSQTDTTLVWFGLQPLTEGREGDQIVQWHPGFLQTRKSKTVGSRYTRVSYHVYVLY